MHVKGGSYQEKAVTGRAAIYFGERVSRLSKQTLRPMEPEVVCAHLTAQQEFQSFPRDREEERRWVNDLLQNEDESCGGTRPPARSANYCSRQKENQCSRQRDV